MPSRFVTTANRDRNRPMAKMTKVQLADALAAHDRIMAESCEIRRRAGLPVLEENEIVKAARARMGAGKVPKVLSPSEQLADLVRRRQKLDRVREQFDADLRALAQSKSIPAAMIARGLGVSRQRIYQLAA